MLESKLQSVFCILAALAILMLVAFGQVPGDIRLSHVLQNTAHAPAFCILSLIILNLLRRWNASSPYLASLVLCLLLGVALEVLQALIGGDASLEDVLTDGLGVIAGLSGAACFRRQKVSVLLLLICMVSSACALAPVAGACAAYINRGVRFPVLATFHSPLDLYFFTRQTPPLQITPSGLLVRLPNDSWPGVTFEEPSPDWSAYRNLVAEFINPTDEPLPLVIRIHDSRHDQTLGDRFNRRFVLPHKGFYRLRIPLTEIQAAPRSRRMDLTQIAGVIVFSTAGSAGRSFYLYEMRLESNPVK